MATIADPNEALADRVRRLRSLKHWTQEELAHEVGVSRNQVHLVETGVTQTLQAETRGAYAHALGVTEHYLVHGYEEEPSGELPTLETYLRLTMGLTDEQIEHVRRTLIALDAERRLAEREVAEEQEPYSAEAKSMPDSGQDDATTPKDVEPTE